MINYFGATVPLGNGFFGRSQGLLDATPAQADPGTWNPQQAAFMQSYAVQPEIYKAYMPPQAQAQETEQEQPFQFKPQPVPGEQREGGYGDRGGPTTASYADTNPDGFLSNGALSAMTYGGMLTGLPLGTMGQAYNTNVANNLAAKMGYEMPSAGFLGNISDALGVGANALSFGLFGNSTRDQASMALAPESFSAAPNQRAINEYNAKVAYDKFAAEQRGEGGFSARDDGGWDTGIGSI